MPTTTRHPNANTASVQEERVPTLDSVAPSSTFTPASPSDVATDEVPSHRLYYTTMIHFLSGFSPDKKAAATPKS